MKPKRVSNIEKFCSKHGKFTGFQWGGHRRICQAKEVSAARWYASMKPPGTRVEVLAASTEDGGNGGAPKAPVAKEKITMFNAVASAFKKLAPKKAPPSAAEKMLGNIRDILFDLDSECSRLKLVIKGASERLAVADAERERIRKAAKSILS